ncbi:hypothetical protein [Mycolicibacterium sp.]|uniref:hypothetical protein n=1 Tax=Mycolicibacterium sp. TaxID=2320850 RepID=UPI0037C85919
MVKVLNADPDALLAASKGINGVISGLAEGMGPVGTYTGGTGRGFSDVALTGKQVGHPGATEALANFAHRWEWGTRALVQKANEIAAALELTGVGFYQQEREYVNNAAKGWANNLAGDPSLSKELTDQMSWGQLVAYNQDRLMNPDYSAESFKEVQPAIEQNLKAAAANTIDAGLPDLAPMPLVPASATEQLTGQPLPSVGHQLMDAVFGPDPAQPDLPAVAEPAAPAPQRPQ